MGNRGSKRPVHRTRIKSVSTSSVGDLGLGENDFNVQSVHQEDLRIINEIRREFYENTPVFMLNNILMSVQFFSDHKEAITRVQNEPASPQEKEMNKFLFKNETMECTYPDILLEEVNENVIFRPLEEASFAENLVPKRIYVTTDLIEVVNSNEIPQYTSIDKPLYQVRLEECEKKGYLKIQQVENNTPILNSREPEEQYDPVPGPSSRPDSEYDYLTITDLRTPKTIEVDSSFQRRDTLPKSCFSYREIEEIPLDDNYDQEELLEMIEEGVFKKQLIYINSKGYMKYFQNTVFPMSLGESLGFNRNSIATAKAIPGKIFCDEQDSENDYIRCYQVIPAISIPWPETQTFNFERREDRPTIQDKRTGIRCTWPTDGMIAEIKNMSAVLVPKGYAKKRGSNKDENLEWEINFPKAERYLEARMSHAQMKCFLVLLAIHKTFIAPHTGENGLLPEHIRAHMFWECEKNWMNWPEHRLGTKILLVIKDLQQHLFTGSLKDYFIKEKDLFENIPKKYLIFAQKIFLNVLENPVPYAIKALGNLRYTSGKFYPPLNYMELYKQLRTNASAGLINPDLLGQYKPPKRRIYEDLDQQRMHLREIKFKEKIIMQRRKEETAKKNEENKIKKINEDIDLDTPIEKKLDIWKTKAILVMFIKLYMEIAKKSARQQALFYLKQAFYLTKILEDESPAFLDEMEEYQQSIAAEETRVKMRTLRSSSMSEEKPPTPVRNSVSFQFNDVAQLTKTSSMKSSLLHTTHMDAIQEPPAKQKMKESLKSPSIKKSLKLPSAQNSESFQLKKPTKRKTVVFQM